MKTVGIIAEYNPFHKGHEYQIQCTKEKLGADFVIVAMSGDFVQRGTPALFPKHLRAEMALRCGADLVLELPVSAATASAEFFARSGVEMLDRLGCVDMLCFGSEAGEIEELMTLAKVFVEEPPEYRNRLKEYLSEGMTFPAARSRAVTEYFQSADSLKAVFQHKTSDSDTADGNHVTDCTANQTVPWKASDSTDFISNKSSVLTSENCDSSETHSSICPTKPESILAEPNNILGIEYCKALLRLNSSIRPVTIQRQGHGYHDTDLQEGNFASATAIRGLVSAPDFKASLDRISEFLPVPARELFKQAIKCGVFLTEDDFDLLLHCALLKESLETLTEYLDMSPDLARRILNQRNAFQSFSQFTAFLKTRELTQTRIQRALLHALLGIREAPASIPYVRVLGFRKESSKLLKRIKQTTRIPLLTKLADAPNLLDETGMHLLGETTFASNLYEATLAHKDGRKFVHEYEKKIVII